MPLVSRVPLCGLVIILIGSFSATSTFLRCVVETGVWPASKSFSDEEMGPVPSKWRGICQNDLDASFRCNR